MKRKRDACAALFQTQLLKVVLTTLYVDIKEPAPNFFGVNSRIYQSTKKPNLISGDNSRCRSSCRDKIEFQFAVPNYARTIPAGVGARFRRVRKIILQERTSNRNNKISFDSSIKPPPGAGVMADYRGSDVATKPSASARASKPLKSSPRSRFSLNSAAQQREQDE
jgi:hypothetical protein